MGVRRNRVPLARGPRWGQVGLRGRQLRQSADSHVQPAIRWPESLIGDPEFVLNKGGYCRDGLPPNWGSLALAPLPCCAAAADIVRSCRDLATTPTGDDRSQLLRWLCS